MNKSLNEILTGRLKKVGLTNFIENNPQLFDEAFNVALGDEKPQSWRAAWMIKHHIKKNDSRIKPKINSILKALPTKEDGHQREFLNIMLEMNLTERQEGILFDKCIIIWKDISKSSSVRGVAFEILLRTAKRYPELITEIEYFSQNHFTETLSPGIKYSIQRKLQLLKSNKIIF